MKYFAVLDKKKLKEAKLTALDWAILRKCDGIGMHVTRLIKAGKPYLNSAGSKEFATTDDIVTAIRKLQKLGFLERR